MRLKVLAMWSASISGKVGKLATLASDWPNREATLSSCLHQTIIMNDFFSTHVSIQQTVGKKLEVDRGYKVLCFCHIQRLNLKLKMFLGQIINLSNYAMAMFSLAFCLSIKHFVLLRVSDCKISNMKEWFGSPAVQEGRVPAWTVFS